MPIIKIIHADPVVLTAEDKEWNAQYEDHRVPTYVDDIPVNSLKSAGQFYDDEAWGGKWGDEFKRGKITIQCPYCNYLGKPLVSRFTLCRGGGYSYYSMVSEYREPYRCYSSRCNKCHKPYRFTLWTAQ